jgi:hypothetical protein
MDSFSSIAGARRSFKQLYSFDIFTKLDTLLVQARTDGSRLESSGTIADSEGASVKSHHGLTGKL